MTFPVCFLIHCRETADDPPGRTELIRQHFAEHGIEPIWIRGIHGRTWGLDTRRWHRRDKAARQVLLDGCAAVLAMGEKGMADATLVEEVWRRILPGHSTTYRIDAGHIGLCLTHWMCWQMAWQMNLQEVLICEDDVNFRPNFRSDFDEHLAMLPADWQIWYAGSWNLDRRQNRQMVNAKLCTVDGGPWGTHCLLIRRSALPVLLDNCVGAYTHVDQLIAERALPHLKWYASHPTLASQHSADLEWPHAVGGYQ